MCVQNMGWWPFSNRKKKDIIQDKVHIKGTNLWLSEMRELCEKHFDAFETGKSELLKLKEEWRISQSNEELDETLIEGLELRASNLLSSTEKEWLELLDNEEFWKPGWRPYVEEE